MTRLMTLARRVAHEEDGAVSVDWVVLCAAVVAIGIAVTTAMQGQLTTAASGIGASISGATGDAEE